MIGKSERRLGVSLGYVREILATSLPLTLRFNRIFGFLDPNTKAPKEAYHIARMRGALAADCGTCVEAERNLARQAGLAETQITACLRGDLGAFDPPLQAVIALTDAVTHQRADAPEAREAIRRAYGPAALIELAFAMNAAALLPGVKRAMGHATTCDLDLLAPPTKGAIR